MGKVIGTLIENYLKDLYEEHPAVVDEIGYGIESCMPVWSPKAGNLRQQTITIIINFPINYLP